MLWSFPLVRFGKPAWSAEEARMGFGRVRARRNSCRLGGRIRRVDVECRLGEGPQAFEFARRALLNWEMFNVGWLEMHGAAPPAHADQAYGIGLRRLGIRLIAVAKIREVRETQSADKASLSVICQAGGRHVVAGRESFTVTMDSRTSVVTYRIRSCSRIVPALRPFDFLVSSFQRRFVRDSREAMRRAVAAYVDEESKGKTDARID